MKYFIKVVLLSFPILVTSCLNRYNKENPIGSHIINDSIFVERYDIYNGGVYGGGLIAEYVTDSISFRKFVGTIEDKEYFDYKITGDTLIVKTFSRRTQHKCYIDSTKYIISSLKRNSDFD